MTKIALKIEDLAVESFATGEAEAPRGTVHGAGITPVCGTDGCQPETVDGCPSPLCPPTSWQTCDGPECA
ncbi:MAG TPA: pinensin family lanthipeptide [Longimicrobium sp.]|jgi:hypothetical protein|uniref:pinensin family lanthipeptide n=1 Tax=Longimicrobium sp. TaxID=2029185 RepID=UPI002EDA3CCE